MRSSDRSNARQFVQSIAAKHGSLSEDVYSRMEPDVRRRVEEAMLKKAGTIGSSVLALSKNLYTSGAKFVFELLQNADRNSYSRAKASSVDPYVSFHVYNRRIVVECNEDGFTHENLVAICSVGKSSRPRAQGYIRERGIGFKSVFMVAWKALIQSGDFSFYLQHKKGDSGMGMIYPVWQDVEDEIPEPLTRITLFLHDSMLEDSRQKCRELDATFLLFMKNLKRIDVAMYDENDKQIEVTTYSIKHHPKNQVELSTEVRRARRSRLFSKKYHLTKHVGYLPRSETRSYAQNNISGGADQKAEVILAFPLDYEDRPIIRPQQVFAFQPIREEEGFSFLIQADFVTDTSGQNIVRFSDRKLKLYDQISKAFIKAISQFCQHPTLRYNWMRYLPQKGHFGWNDFRASLLSTIELELLKAPVLWTRSHGELRPIRAMRLLKPHMFDHAGNPLFPDSVPGQYLASEYSAADLDILKGYGLFYYMSEGEFLKKLEFDLKNDSPSIVKSLRTGEEWHSRLADYLIFMLPTHRKTIENFALIPLIGGRWTSARHTPVYYSTVNDEYPIPTDLGLNLVDPKAEKNTQRKRLFGSLGVKNAETPDIRKLIFGRYKFLSLPITDLATSRCHLNFLYLTAQLNNVQDEVRVSYLPVHILDHERRGKKSGPMYPVYFLDGHPYGARELFRTVGPDTESEDGADEAAPGLDVSFIHHEYMGFPPKRPHGERRSWRAWLRDMVGIYDFIPLFSPGEIFGTYRLSKECLYVAKHRPKKFLGFLLENWRQTDNDTIIKYPNLRTDLLKLEVLCETDHKYPLGKTYLPIAEHQHARMFLEDDEFFPWLRIEPSLRDDEAKFSELQALAKKLGFGIPKSDVDFHIDMLRYIHSANGDASKLTRETRVYDLYSRIEAQYRGSVDQEACRQQIKSAFESSPIYVPAYGPWDACWASYDECRWNGPAHMLSTYFLIWHYENLAATASLVRLFSQILEMSNVTAIDLLIEVQELQLQADPNFDHIYSVYQYMGNREALFNDSERALVRQQFQDYHLVYAGSNEVDTGCWYSPSDCLWSDGTKIKGMRDISEIYKGMSLFFVHWLGVRKLTLELMIGKLADQGRDEETCVEEIKKTIWQVNDFLIDFLEDEKDLPSPESILEGNIFPVKYPNNDNDNLVELCSSKTDFAIADNELLLDSFSGKAKILDFSVSDVLRLEPFFRWTGLEYRYLSWSAEEITSLVDDDSGKLLVSPDRDLALKAHGLFRIAVHFRSPRTLYGRQDLYDELKKIKVYETGGIKSQFHLTQDEKVIIVESDGIQAHLPHLQDHKDGLRVYVPRGEDLQYQCFLDRVPEGILEWIMEDPVTGICDGFNDSALDVMRIVILAQNKYISTILTRHGIISIETPDESINAKPSDTSPIRPEPAGEHIPGDSQGDTDWERDTLVQDKTRRRSPNSHPVKISDMDDSGDIEFTSATAAHRSSSQVVNPIISTPSQGTASSRLSLS